MQITEKCGNMGGGYIGYICRNSSVRTLKMGNLLHVNYTSIKLIKRKCVGRFLLYMAQSHP